MRKGLGGYPIAVILGLGIAVFVWFLYFGPWVELGAAGMCQNIYAYYPSFRCCDEIQDWSGSKKLTYNLFTYDNGQTYKCPDTASHCEVYLSNPDFAAGTKVYKGMTNCRQTGLFLQAWECNDDTPVSLNMWFSVPGGTWVHLIGQTSVKIDYVHYRYVLCESGLSPSGVPCPAVLGADGCGFNTDMSIYNQAGRIKITADAGAKYAYTVPFGSCYTYFPETNRHVIGDTCEECSDNQDCVERYGKSYTYNGVKYGAVCGSGQVQLYSCQNSGGEICVKWREDSNGEQVECLEYGQKTRCDLYKAISVQCCPGTSSCGPGAFCNPDTYLCEETAECTTDTDCGHVIQCDYTDLKLKDPVCISGSCGFDETPVECCGDINCPTGYYCGADYKCREKTNVKDVCPYQCCINEAEFFDRPCPLGQECCGDHTCQVSCDGNPPTTDSYFWLIIPALAVLLGAIGFWAKGALGGVILGIIGGLCGYLIWWFSQLEWWAQLLIFLGLGGLGAIGIYLFGGLIMAVITAIVLGMVKE